MKKKLTLIGFGVLMVTLFLILFFTSGSRSINIAYSMIYFGPFLTYFFAKLYRSERFERDMFVYPFLLTTFYFVNTFGISFFVEDGVVSTYPGFPSIWFSFVFPAILYGVTIYFVKVTLTPTQPYMWVFNGIFTVVYLMMSFFFIGSTIFTNV
jgi:hypothetical protein